MNPWTRLDAFTRLVDQSGDDDVLRSLYRRLVAHAVDVMRRSLDGPRWDLLSSLPLDILERGATWGALIDDAQQLAAWRSAACRVPVPTGSPEDMALELVSALCSRMIRIGDRDESHHLLRMAVAAAVVCVRDEMDDPIGVVEDDLRVAAGFSAGEWEVAQVVADCATSMSEWRSAVRRFRAGHERGHRIR